MTSPLITQGPSGLSVISSEVLKKFVPDAFESADPDDLDQGLWVMTKKPVPLEEPDDDGFVGLWSETNEPELAEWWQPYSY